MMLPQTLVQVYCARCTNTNGLRIEFFFLLVYVIQKYTPEGINLLQLFPLHKIYTNLACGTASEWQTMWAKLRMAKYKVYETIKHNKASAVDQRP